MPDRPSLLPRLRQETAQSHRELEDAVQIARTLGNESSYRKLLEVFHGFYAPMEEQLSEAQEWELEGIHFDERRKADWIKQDLQALGLGADQINSLPTCEDLPVVNENDFAFGSFYVLEGSTLGGRHISAMLQTSPISEHARRFFRGYGEDTGTMWKQFCNSLEGFAEHADHGKIIRGADATFRSLQRWIAHEGLHA
ncbi:biliverdin-producing heme oxygenase [Roseimicrobium sp. ORNL1]|uniref:biliverdin-producing heme oxygenase n=1 Tax=Roseimicrobium sp. ORNL1 TaxID=2711231 RepID=UPI0013E15296|nr:biliverdin-producing heme oxygenase [Roseimicrobium sp. ORNL1]QIF04005.1 biliverdin-producing heme oxygenase [Roseimicrobium sp. ORNL1]